MGSVVLIDVVGLTARHIGEHTPRLRALADARGMRPVGGVLPAVTMSAQATMLRPRVILGYESKASAPYVLPHELGKRAP